MTSNEAFVSQAPITVYLNSNAAKGSTSTTNELQFVFDKPITKEPDDLVFCSLQSFQSFNTFASISKYQQNNVMKIINRMYNAVTKVYTDIETRVIIPDDHYDSGSLMAYLNTHCQRQLQVFDANWVSNDDNEAWLYLGFGFNGQNNTASATPIQGFLANPLDSGLTWLQPGVTVYTNAYTKTYTSGSIATDPYAYAGVYLLDDDETHGFMESIGYANRFSTPPVVASNIRGYGYNFPITEAPQPQTAVSSPFTINLSGPWILYFVIDRLSTNSRHNDPQMDQMNIVGTVPVPVYYGQYINYQQQNNSNQFVDDLNTMSFYVTIYDQNRKLVDFRGQQWCAEISITIKSNARLNALHRNNPEATNPVHTNPMKRPLFENPTKRVAIEDDVGKKARPDRIDPRDNKLRINSFPTPYL